MMIHPALPDPSDSDVVVLNIGCGKHPIEGCINIDQTPDPNGHVLVRNLDSTDVGMIGPADLDSVDGVFGSHVIEHITNVLPLMDWLYHVCKPDARAVFKTPYGSSDDAWANPTHVRPMFVDSWAFFGQPHYWREDYGYRGDWVLETVELTIDEPWASGDLQAIWPAVSTQRNVVKEMTAVLRCQKPARAADRALQSGYDVVFQRAEMINAFQWEAVEIGRLRVDIQT